MKQSEKVWIELWEKRKEHLRQYPLWNFDYELMYSILATENVILPGKTCLEAGSGTGRLSLKLAENGAKPILLDISRNAVMFSKKLADVKDVEADFVVGSTLCLPFRSSSFDTVWSAGVIEHFVPEGQNTIVNESLRVLKNGAKLIIIVPNKKAWIYNFFRVLTMKIRTWPYGYEHPLTVEDFKRFSPKPIAFHSCGWIFSQFNTINLPVVTPAVRRLIKIIECILKSYFIAIEKSHPGYILAAVWVKQS